MDYPTAITMAADGNVPLVVVDYRVSRPDAIRDAVL